MALMGSLALWGGWACGLYSLLLWWRAERHRVTVRTTLLPPTTKASAPERRLPALLLRMADGLADRAAGLALAGDRQKWEHTLSLAGRPYGLTVRLFGGVRLVLVLAALIAGNLLLALGFSPVVLPLLVIAGYMGPAVWLKGKAQTRQAEIGRQLPDLLDTVACTLEAGGLGLDQAMERVAGHFRGPLYDEVRSLLAEIGLGVPRREAMEHMRQRTACRELDAVLRALVQADVVGASVVTAFTLQAESIRTYRAQRAREVAARVETSLLCFGGVLGFLSLLFILALLVLNYLYNPAFAGWRSMW